MSRIIGGIEKHTACAPECFTVVLSLSDVFVRQRLKNAQFPCRQQLGLSQTASLHAMPCSQRAGFDMAHFERCRKANEVV